MTKTNANTTKKFDHDILGPCQAVVTICDDLPDGFVLPSIPDMTQDGPEFCDHSCDFEHIQTVGDHEFLTFVMWTTDGGYGAFPEGTELVGCQWIAGVREWDEPFGIWGGEWDTEVAEVILDCDADGDERVSAEVALGLLSEALRGEF